MAKELIRVSLTEFINFVNKSGASRATIVIRAKNNRDEEYAHYKDYWLKLREKIKETHKNNGSHDDLKSVISTLKPDKQENYRCLIDGYCTFWKKKKIEWLNPCRHTWAIGDMRVELNPELGLVVNNKIYIIKLFTSINDTIDKKHADLILSLMEKELRAKVGGDEVIFAVLDVKRGKLFENKTKDTSLYSLLKGEARSFESQWKDIE